MIKTTLKLTLLISILVGSSCSKPEVDDITAESAGPGKNQATVSQTLAMKGVKWKNEMDGQDNASSPRFETHGLSYAQAAAGLEANGVGCVVLKVAEQNIMPAGTSVDEIHTEVVNMVKALKNNAPNVKVYVWQRQNLLLNHNLNGKDEDFAEEMKLLINKAKAQNCDDKIKGIAVIENNLENMSQVLSQALSIARKINSKTGGWLKTKTFLFPGAAMGEYFKDVHVATGHATFFDDMAPEVESFSFIYKHMESKVDTNCSLGSLNAEWEATVGKNATTTQAQQVDYLNQNMGLNNLTMFLSNHQAQYPNLCNVTFWGDQGDGMILMSQTNVRAVHEALVETSTRLWKSYFLDMAYALNTATGKDLSKYLLTVTSSGVIAKNTSLNTPGVMSVWDEWNKWPWASPGY